MATELIISVVAEDRPGIVDRVSRAVAELHGNWMESRMVRMAGRFAGIIRIECAEAERAALRTGLEALQSEGIRVIIDDEFDGTGDDRSSGIESRRVRLAVTANDRPGIVQEVSHCLASLGSNVVQFETDCHSGAMSGQPMFTARIDVDVPEEIDHTRLVTALHDLSHDLMVDLEE